MADSTRANEVGSFGEQLRQAREARHITLQEIAATTKISCRALQALEDEHFDVLPGGIFNKGFVRSYARYVGLDEEKMLAAYLAAAKLESSETDMQAMSSQVSTARARAQEPAVSGTTLVGILALIVALGLGALWLKEQRREAKELSMTAPPAASTAAPAAAAPSAAVPGAVSNPGAAGTASGAAGAAANPGADTSLNTKGPAQNSGTDSAKAGAAALPVAAASKAAEAVSSEQAEPVEVSISATQRAWISVKSDGKTVESLTLDPDKPEMRSRSYKAKEKLVLVVGNPAGVTVTYNGKPAGTLGPEGQRAIVTFTPQGMEKQ